MVPRWLTCVVVALATQTVYAQTAPVAAPGYEDDTEVDSSPVAPSAPPALPNEQPTARPFSGAIWTAGHWFWDGAQWRFKQGSWIAPMTGYHFINGYWRQDSDGWRWVSSGWARAGSNQVEIPVDVVNEELTTTQAPPPAPQEDQPPAPAPNLTWAPGYWYWTGSDWVWIEGSWVSPPRPGLVFVSPSWVFRAGFWVFVGGGWALPGSRHVVVPVYRHAGIAVRSGHPNSYHEGYHGNEGYRENEHRGPPPSSSHPAPPVHGHRGGTGGGGHHH